MGVLRVSVQTYPYMEICSCSKHPSFPPITRSGNDGDLTFVSKRASDTGGSSSIT